MKDNIIDFEYEYYSKLAEEGREEQIELDANKSYRWVEIDMLEKQLEALKIAYILDYGETHKETFENERIN
jgi:citrate synthase